MHRQRRSYDPLSGRWISRDPYWNPSNMIYSSESSEMPSASSVMQSSNLYGYVIGNPILFADPIGLEKIVISGGIYSKSKKDNNKYYKVEAIMLAHASGINNSEKLYITKNKINSLKANAFNNPMVYFYSCKTGEGKDSLAQTWVNKVGGQQLHLEVKQPMRKSTMDNH